MAQMLPEMGYMPMPQEMPHSSDSLQGSGAGQGPSTDLLNEASLDGVISEDERQSNLQNSGS